MDEKSRKLGELPMADTKFSVLELLDHQVNESSPQDRTLDEYWPNWAESWPQGPWATLNVMSLTVDDDVVKDFWASKKKLASAIRTK